ncbi:UDP-3-O-[3-hydroxymyristoyl] glucosamine N-acyltransferase [Marinobacterium lacunae]|uniref:UDP-3-O-acylglucosamine N-acyltransferase n=1 Tax=Marinobacterium lacunae TaxID=1232683 RepID=A0A081G0R3_9GAMM|nr:UDP-3-O-(3-hydroxymyristoyl)glucosamine N-acyltransferase [Marinobacterium lacunae]KEA64368.1 UDP-3-O-[3-hydroxymyristoyl] glucosamine N-acyltransferase [Marinobacterium lacunae]
MSNNRGYTLSELAAKVGGRVSGDPARVIHSLATLQTAGSGQLSFFANGRYLKQLRESHAEAVLVSDAHETDVQGVAVVVADPYLAFAELTRLFDWRLAVRPGIHPSAQVAEGVQVSDDAEIGPGVVLGERVVVEAGVSIGANSVIGRDSVIGADTRIEANVTLYPGVRVGRRVLIHSGAVLGADGFGFAHDKERWIKICQLGGVVIGDDVEIGANTTIDRGALEDTWIERGVKLDNQIQIAHNVRIGEHTAIAGCTAIAGSTRIGRHCTVAGMSGITGHLEIADGTHITAMSLVSRSITRPGAYSSGTGLEPHQQWKRNVVRFRQLDELARRVRKLEQALEHISIEGQDNDGC